jgi:hypothetical protein
MQFLQIIKKTLSTFLFVAYMLLTQGWQALGIVIIAILNDRPWECIFIFIGFIAGRRFFGKTYHAPTMNICTVLTWVTFYFLTSAVPSFSISITMPCIFGICLAFILSIIGEYLEKERDYGG